MQRIQYAKTKSDIIAKADGTFVPREKRKRHDDKGTAIYELSVIFQEFFIVKLIPIRDYKPNQLN